MKTRKGGGEEVLKQILGRGSVAERHDWVQIPFWLLADVVLSSAEFNFSATLVNNQLVYLPSVGILNLVMFIWIFIHHCLFALVLKSPNQGVANYVYILHLHAYISRPLQHSNLWLLHFLVSNDLSSSVVTTILYFSSWLNTTIITTTELTHYVPFKGTTTWFIKSMSNCQLGCLRVRS